jgi:Mg-chelatase subunit ChlD
MGAATARAPRVVADTKRVIFVLDASASMIDNIARARSFIISAVRQLPHNTAVDFNVILAGEGGPRRFTSGPEPLGLKTDRKLATALESTFTSGETNLLPALNAAIDQVPDTIWLITDGDIRDREAFANRLRQMNAGLRARINTVVAITDTNRAGVAKRESATTFLRDIAAQHKGTCYSVDGWLIDPDLDAKLDAFAAARAAQARNPGARRAPTQNVTAGPVRNLLFVVDAGESMRERLSLIAPELQKAVAAMPPGTAFNVLLAAQDRVTIFRPQPVAPTQDVAQALGSFMRSYTPRGGSELWPALEEAFNQRPSMIWLVAGSEVADPATFLKRLSGADPQRRTRVNTTVALPDVAQSAATSPKAASLVDLLTRIAADYHGRCTDLAGAPVAPPAAAPTTAPSPSTQPDKKGASPVFDDL